MLILATSQSFMNTFSKCLQHRKEKNEISLSGDAQELFPPNFGQHRQCCTLEIVYFRPFTSKIRGLLRIYLHDQL